MKYQSNKGVHINFITHFLVLLITLFTVGCGLKKGVIQDEQSSSNVNAVPLILGFAAWELWVFAAAGGAVVIWATDQATGQQQQFSSREEATNYLTANNGTIAAELTSSQQSSYSAALGGASMINQGAFARPPKVNANGSSIPSTISNQCKNQKRPPEDNCEESFCYISPSASNAAAARRIHSQTKPSDNGCFVFKWQGNENGSDPAHSWLPHYHLYEKSESGQCNKNIHFYYSRSVAEFDNYKGRCKKY